MKKTGLVICCTCLIRGCKKLIIATPSYAEGIVYYYDTGPHNSTINYNFYANGLVGENQYSNGYHGWYVPAGKHYTQGDKFMVQYDSADFNTSRMLFDYPITDTATFIQDSTYLSTHPPK